MGFFDRFKPVENDLVEKSGFDRVDLREDDGSVTSLTHAKWNALPADRSVKAILQKRLTFYRNGKEITMREALGPLL